MNVMAITCVVLMQIVLTLMDLIIATAQLGSLAMDTLARVCFKKRELNKLQIY